MPEIEVFLGGNLNFTIKVFWGVLKNIKIYAINMMNLQNILFCLI